MILYKSCIIVRRTDLIIQRGRSITYDYSACVLLCALFGAAFEDHSEMTTDPEFRGRRNYGHAVVCLQNISAL